MKPQLFSVRFSATLKAQGKNVNSLSVKLDGVGGRKKLTNMQYCLGDACFRVDLEFLKRAGSIALHQDVRQLVLMIRFSACTPEMDTAKGLFGFVELQTGNNRSLQEGTQLVLDGICKSDPLASAHIKKHVET